MIKPQITVLMPVYNGALYLREAIESVLEQSFADFEFLIINDGSTDDSVQVINSYKDERIKLISQKNAGVSVALNNGLKYASGNYIARMDADDICKAGRLEQQYNFLSQNEEYIMVGSDADYIDKDGVFIFQYHNIGYTNEEIKERIMVHCPFIHSTVMYLRNAVQEAGAYNENAYLFEDYFLWIKLIQKGKVCNLKEILMTIRFNPASVTIDDKDCSEAFLKLKQKALHTGVLTDAEGAVLKSSITKISAEKKLFSYHSLLGKKYLWNNYEPSKARQHFISAIKVNPLKMTSYALCLLTFIPASFIGKLYRSVKSKQQRSWQI